jgi:hypothetical protein
LITGVGVCNCSSTGCDNSNCQQLPSGLLLYPGSLLQAFLKSGPLVKPLLSQRDVIWALRVGRELRAWAGTKLESLCHSRAGWGGGDSHHVASCSALQRMTVILCKNSKCRVCCNYLTSADVAVTFVHCAHCRTPTQLLDRSSAVPLQWCDQAPQDLM